ncbi:MAG: Crp/Fnr family transcriptional regulator [Deltaproteobacteria bacterium]|nr:Crp/Fnr family transcriptional regulator [Deltaproteobacteria bacterium]
MEAKEITAKAALHPLLAVLEADILGAVVRASKLISFRARRTILKEGDPPQQAFCLLSGAVRVFHRSAEGNEVTVKLFRAPALFGEMEVLAGRPFMEYVTTLEPADILLVPAAVLLKLVKTQRSFAEAMAVDLSLRLCIATHNERALAFCDVDTRLANLLVDYAELAGEPRAEGGIRISVPLTGESMAKDLAVSRKSLVRSLAKLDELGLATKSDGRYVVADLEALRRRGSGTLGLTYNLTPGAAWSPAPPTAPEDPKATPG